MQAHVAPWKKGEVAEMEKILTSHPVVAIVSIDGIPSASMQKIRSGLRGSGEVRSGKNNLLKLALEGAAKKVPGLKELEPEMHGQTAVVVSELNPFRLYRQFMASKAMAPARPGQVAPVDIEVKRGDTPFKPGPVVGELQKVGIPAVIDAGKVIIRSDKLLVKAGDVISADMASVLSKLQIHPIEIGLKVHAIYENGLLYRPEVLGVDEKVFNERLTTAIRNGLSLAVAKEWATKQTIELIVARAVRQALAVGARSGFLTRETIAPALSKAFLQALAMAKLAKGEPLDKELEDALGGPAAPAPTGKPAEEKKKEKEEVKVSEDEAAEGLGSLFG